MTQTGTKANFEVIQRAKATTTKEPTSIGNAFFDFNLAFSSSFISSSVFIQLQDRISSCHNLSFFLECIVAGNEGETRGKGKIADFGLSIADLKAEGRRQKTEDGEVKHPTLNIERPTSNLPLAEVNADNKAVIFLIKRIPASFPPPVRDAKRRTADKFQVNRKGVCVDIRIASASPKAGETSPLGSKAARPAANGGYIVVRIA